MITKGVFLLGVGALALGFATTTAAAAELFTLKSTTFADSKMMPTKVANSQANAPANATPHHYTFVLIATDFDPKELPPGLTRDELTAKFGPAPAHLKGTTGMIGLSSILGMNKVGMNKVGVRERPHWR